MLPLPLLRVNIMNKGKNITPLFCLPAKDSFYELKLAESMIKEFEESYRKKEKKRKLGERISLLESGYDDYRLVRGLYVLLERRCTFGSGEGPTSQPNIGDNEEISDIDSFHIRKYLFEESSKQGYALTEHKRKEIIGFVASKISMSYDMVVREMWSDLDENFVLEDFASIEPQKLIAWYNLSLMQTLLFNSTKLEFSVQGGSNWKRALRAVKKLGLMYSLQYQQSKNSQEDQEMLSNQKVRQDMHPAFSSDFTSPSRDAYEDNILCSIDGPLSIFKLTDRYGTSIAKLLPSITEAAEWSLRAYIVRKTASAGKKIYEFIISNKESPDLPKPTDLFIDNYSNIKNTIFEKPLSSFSSTQPTFDSSVEQKFAVKFEQICNDWRLIREPDPLVVSDGRGFIPDFAFEKYGIRVYLEIVGFWTNEYLLRKIQKIADVISLSSSKISPSPVQTDQRFGTRDFFVAVNMDSYVSDTSKHNEKVLASLRLSNYIKPDHLIKYKNDNIPVKPILDHLRTIDIELVKRLARVNSANLVDELNRIASKNNPHSTSDYGGIISLEKIAERYGVPVESVSQVIRESEDLKNGSLNDNYFIEDRYLIPVTLLEGIKQVLRDHTSYIEACKVLKEQNVPEVCYESVLQKSGYDIIWHSMDINRAAIKLRASE
ncbi:MAG TPA: DUF790 family protein [Nitrososphaeraceae archaeon]|nr:DUF790 family protein [Nitrososphaeraceae archaeon]